ncbi:hypothetical protein ACSFA0_19760 [Variovorax sp. LT1P1]|uniref:hypothetical protein n=1 Tax=Variovorax sp. LT1P1 TaxID=3443730 RepID=UPI003F45BA38
MTKKKIDNSLYYFLVGRLSNALPLEFAIRASQSSYPMALERLQVVDKEIRACLREWGAREEEIDAEELIDYAWDLLQIGFPRVRLHGRILTPEISQILTRCRREIHSKINLRENDLAIPAAKYFRVCGLLNGNDIREMLLTSIKCLGVAGGYQSTDDIELREFSPVWRIREPIRLHRGIDISIDCTESGRHRHCLCVEVDSVFDVLDIERQMDEFLYQLALMRELRTSPQGDVVSSKLFNRVLARNVSGESSEELVTRIDGIAAVLAGLYCWDLHKKNHLRLEDAKQEALKIYERGEDAMKKNYDSVRAKINEYAVKFETGAIVDGEPSEAAA